MIKIPSESIGSIPRPTYLINAVSDKSLSKEKLDQEYQRAVRETIAELEKTGSEIIGDGEQLKPSFVTYPLCENEGVGGSGVTIPFADGHTRQLPTLKAGNFKYKTYASEYVKLAKTFTTRPIKQSVISPSAMSLLYPPVPIEGYTRQQFLDDIVNEAETDIRNCFREGASVVQIDVTEARLSLKLDPSGSLLKDFIDLNNRVLERFTELELAKIGVHTCSGSDVDSTHSHDVSYTEQFLPALFKLKVGRLYLEFAGEEEQESILEIINDNINPKVTYFMGVIDVISPIVETADDVYQMIIKMSEYIPIKQLGTCDNCGFSPFMDDLSTSREIAFQKITNRIQGTLKAQQFFNQKMG